MRRVSIWMLLAILAPAWGCRQPGYQATAPHRAARPGLTAQITYLDFQPHLVATLTVEAATRARVRRVLLAPSDAEPCHEGIRESDAKLDGQPIWARPLEINGRHDLGLTFGLGAAAQVTAQPASLDLVLAGEAGQPDQCLRVALNGTAAELAWKARTTGTAGAAVRFMVPAHSVNGLDTGWSIDSRIGGYAGPVRLLGELGVGGAHCSEHCLGSTLGFLWLPLGVSAHWFAYDAKGTALDVGLAYRLTLAGISHGQDSRSQVIQAPELRLRWAGTVQRGPGLPSGARVGSAGYELFASEWFGKGPNGPEHTFVLGLGIVGDGGF